MVRKPSDTRNVWRLTTLLPVDPMLKSELDSSIMAVLVIWPPAIEVVAIMVSADTLPAAKSAVAITGAMPAAIIFCSYK